MNLLGAGPYLFSPFIAFDLWIWFETARVRTYWSRIFSCKHTSCRRNNLQGISTHEVSTKEVFILGFPFLWLAIVLDKIS